MNLRKLTLATLSIITIVVSCNNDDDETYYTVPDRDRTEVYNEDIAKIEEYLQTHFYNYEDFDFSDPYGVVNDDFEIVFDTIAGDNSDKTPLIDQVGYKVAFSYSDEIEYRLYYLKVREGQGKELYPTDQAFLDYEGSRLTDGYVFDSTANPTLLNLTTVSTTTTGVIDGFRQGLTEFKTATEVSDNGDGTDAYRGFGIGAIFIPSGLGYFSSPTTTIPAYSSLIFKIGLKGSVHTDYDFDGVPSYLEDLNADDDAYTDDTDGDLVANLIDNDDDGDGVLTIDEVEVKSYTEDETMTPFASQADAQTYFDNNAEANEYFVSIVESNDGTIITLNTVVLTDSNNDGTPDYLDSSVN
ncbi:FKBP-type peptidyl-prolyl cis-trans isomerase [Corallibacter sp.]|uniref:FKBP-type peptidyl-prolyl cis-trans isomerase n=1 Tax=Corallibacter sp. TaxID=2038084 RepID=UPI003A8EC5DD